MPQAWKPQCRKTWAIARLTRLCAEPSCQAASDWSTHVKRALNAARRLRYGTVWINDFHPYLPQAEWGGFGKSGTGRELGPAGLAEYRETKHIYQNLAPKPVRWFAG